MKNQLTTLIFTLSLATSLSQMASAHHSLDHQQNKQSSISTYDHVAKDTDRDDQHQGRHHRFFFHQAWFWDGTYDCYSFGPDCAPVELSAEQLAYAQQEIKHYLERVWQGLQRPSGHRYIALETLPTPGGSRCVTVYDSRAGGFIGHAGYAVGGLPPAGSIVRLASVRAELVVS